MALHFGRAQDDLERTAAAGPRQERDVLCGQIRRLVEAFPECRVARSADNCEALFVNRLVEQIGVVEVQVINRQVQISAGQPLRDQGTFVRQYLQLHLRRQRHQPGHQAR
ncbi:hypothetical protein D3C72_1403120 [compost metagenome]